jgi:hypothetical protein
MTTLHVFTGFPGEFVVGLTAEHTHLPRALPCHFYTLGMLAVLERSPVCAGEGVCPYFSAVPNHRHVLWSRVTDSCLFLDILDITDMFWTFSSWTLVLSDRLHSLRVA